MIVTPKKKAWRQPQVIVVVEGVVFYSAERNFIQCHHSKPLARLFDQRRGRGRPPKHGHSTQSDSDVPTCALQASACGVSNGDIESFNGVFMLVGVNIDAVRLWFHQKRLRYKSPTVRCDCCSLTVCLSLKQSKIQLLKENQECVSCHFTANCCFTCM